MTRALTTMGVRASVVVEASDWELMMLYASLGMGVAIVNDHCAPPRGARRVPIPAAAQTSPCTPRASLRSSRAARSVASSFGHRFQRSTSGVWLTEAVAPEYLEPPSWT